MDWQFIGNAEGARLRVVSLVYLCRERYGLDPSEAGRKLRQRFAGTAYCEQVIAEATSSLASDEDISLGTICSPEQARRYLGELVLAYHAPRGGLMMFDLAKKALRRYQTCNWPSFSNVDQLNLRSDA